MHPEEEKAIQRRIENSAIFEEVKAAFMISGSKVLMVIGVNDNRNFDLQIFGEPDEYTRNTIIKAMERLDIELNK
jgi:hypothetical protein